ncbi:MAG: hypothetical protein K0S63_665, partial [Gammaproteobacteria bacterium]|nr:hypothetical protein [Gammaproteobacteria bacterium]
SETLDRLHRFIRLADHLGWDYDELDWAICWSMQLTDSSNIDPLTFDVLARLSSLQKKYNCSVKVLCTFFADMKTTGVSNNVLSETLFDQVFNQPIAFNNFTDQASNKPYYQQDDGTNKPYHPQYATLDTDDVYVNPLYTEEIQAWQFSDNEKSHKNNNRQLRTHLLAALQISDRALDFMLQHLFFWSLKTTTPFVPVDHIISLDVPALTQFYRFSQLAKLQNISVIESVILMDVLDLSFTSYASSENLTFLEYLLRWSDWLKQSPLSVYQLQYLVDYPFEPNIFLSQNDFVNDDITPETSASIFSQLVEAGFIGQSGTVLNKQPITEKNLKAALDSSLESDVPWVQTTLLCYLKLQYKPLNAINVGLKYVNTGFDRDTVPGVLTTLQNESESILVKKNSFIIEDSKDNLQIDSEMSEQIYATLLAGDWITTHGVVIEQPRCAFDALWKSDEKQAVIDYVYQLLREKLYLQKNLVTEKIANYLNAPVELIEAISSILSKSSPSVLTFSGDKENYVSIEQSNKFALPEKFTIDLLLRLNQFTKENQCIFSQGDNWELARVGLTSDVKFSMKTDENTTTYIISENLSSADFPFEDGDWHHLAITYDGKNLNFYFDGFGMTTTSAEAPYKNTEALICIGGNVQDLSRNFKGQIARVRVWNEALPSEQVSSLRFNDTSNDKNLEACWLLNTGYGRAVYNAANNLYTGMVQGQINWRNNSPHYLLNDNEAVEENIRQRVNAELLLSEIVKHKNLSQWLEIDATVLKAFCNNPSPFTADIPALTYGFSYDARIIRTFNAYRDLVIKFDDTKYNFLKYFNLPGAPLGSNKIQTLSLITAWDAVQISILENNLNSKNEYNFNTVMGIGVLYDSFEICKKLNIQAHVLVDLANLNNKLDDGNWDEYTQLQTNLLQSSNALYKDANGSQLDVARQKSIEENKSRLLSAYLLSQLSQSFNDIQTLDDLYAFLLVDVQMSGDILISPIKLAINSVQLYIQRCQLSLEPEVACSIPERQWKWMQSFRTWQANRAVYLYPENYVDPNLRRFQTPFYEQVKSQLLQGYIDDDKAEATLSNALASLNEIANMQLVDAYYGEIGHDVKEKAEKIVFLLARTYSDPKTFYYRKIVLLEDKKNNKEYMRWSAWEKVDAVINADTASIIYAFNKLFVVWVEQANKTLTDTSQNNYSVTTAAIKFSFQTPGKAWSSQQTLRDDLVIFVSGGNNAVDKKTYSDYLQGFPYDGTSNAYTETSQWSKVKLTRTSANSQEAILMLYGDLVYSKATVTSAPPSCNKASGLDEVIAFNEMLYNASLISYNLKAKTGFKTSVVPVLLLNLDLVAQCSPLEIKDDNLSVFYNRYQFQAISNKNCLTVDACSVIRKQGYWLIQDGAGTTIQDSINSANNGIVNTSKKDSTATWNQVSSSTAYYLWLQNNAYIDFSATGANPNFSLNYGPNPNNVFEIKFMFRVTNNNHSRNIIRKGSEWSVGIYKDGSTYRLRFALYLTGNGDDLSQSVIYQTNIKVAINKDTWYTVIVSAFLDFEGSDWTQCQCQLKTSIATSQQDLNKNTQTSKATITRAQTNVSVGELIRLAAPRSNDDVDYAFSGYVTDLSMWFAAKSTKNIQTVFASSADPSHCQINEFDMIVNHPLTLLENLRPDTGRVVPMNNRPNWALLDTGKESFLIMSSVDCIGKLNDLMNVSIGDDLKGTISVTFDTPDSKQFGDQTNKAKFIRLATNTIGKLSQKLLVGGPALLFTQGSQFSGELPFTNYQPNSDYVFAPHQDYLDFNGAYGEYFWELFFYVPFLIANQLSANKNYEAAKKWYEYIFNPTAKRNIESFWPVDDGSDSIRDMTGAMPGHIVYDSTTVTPQWLQDSSFPPDANRIFLSFGAPFFIELDNSETYELPQHFTLEAWFKIISNPRCHQVSIIGKDASTWEIMQFSGQNPPPIQFILRLDNVSNVLNSDPLIINT